jgi:putative FmdB family regulatory protein
MPIYEYRCASCEHIFDELVANAQAPAPACPKCGAGKSEKLMSAVGGILSGSARPSCPSGPSCQSAPSGGCRSCPMSNG